MNKKIVCSLLTLLTLTLSGCNEAPHEHTFSSEWSKDELSHWHDATCDHTELISGKSTHQYGDDNICDVCGYEKEIITPVHEHTYSDRWSKDETNHWHASNCGHEGFVKDLSAHNYGDDNICDDCGYIKETPEPVHVHTFDEEHWEKDSENHWHKATCGHNELTSGLASHTFGDDNICDVCGFVKEIAPVPHEHTYSASWSYDETNHWHASNCGHEGFVKDLSAHNYGDDNICDDCGFVKPAEEHIHTYDLDNWCTSSTHHWHASNCEHVGLAIDLAEHTFDEDGVCTSCGYEKEKAVYAFNFKSDYCELDNEEIYEEGEEIEVNLTLKEEFESSLELPTEIEISSNGELLTKDVDYTYEIIGNLGIINLKVNGNILVQVFRNSDESAFKITEQEFETAIDTSNFDYVQYYFSYYFYSKTQLLLIQREIDFCPNVVYGAGAQIYTSRSSGQLNYQYTYLEKEDDVYSEYTCSNSSVWEKGESNVYTFESAKSISLISFPYIGSDFTLTYDAIKDHYNSTTHAYEIEFTLKDYVIQFEVSFYEGKIINISYNCDQDTGFFGNVTLAYEEKEVVIPEDVKPHVHTFADEWTKDETGHWHAATCGHDELKDGFEPHSYGDDGICTICGYEPEYLYPVIVKEEHIGAYGHTKTVSWDEDLGQAVITTTHSDSLFKTFMIFDEEQNIVSEGIVNGDEFVVDIVNTYENGLKTSTITLNNGVVEDKETFEYNKDKKLISNKSYNVDGETETLIRETSYEYTDNYRVEYTRHFNESKEVTYYAEYKWVYSIEGENRKETLFSRFEPEGEYKEIGYVVYNKLEQIIETKDTIFAAEIYSIFEIVTYTEDGELASILKYDEGEYGTKDVYTYDENGFLIKKETFEYDESAREYNKLVSGVDYVVDEKGTIIRETFYTIIDSNKSINTIVEYDVKYVTVDFHDSGYVPETKGTYNQDVLDYLSIIG